MAGILIRFGLDYDALRAYAGLTARNFAKT
jgi:hypothetical protein